MGLGAQEIVIILAVVALLFGPALAVAWLAWTIARSTARAEDAEEADHSMTEATDPAILVARERYARGEITKEELEEIRSTLGY